jgi:hypothetical protein
MLLEVSLRKKHSISSPGSRESHRTLGDRTILGKGETLWIPSIQAMLFLTRKLPTIPLVSERWNMDPGIMNLAL